MSGRKRRAARRARERVERQQDPRLVAAKVAQDARGGIPAEHWVVVVSPLELDDGRLLKWHPPQPVAFNLLEAKRYRDRGVKARRGILGNLVRRADGALQPSNTHATIDCLSDLAAAVLFSFTAIESLANHVIEMLSDDTVVTVRKGREVARRTRGPDPVRRAYTRTARPGSTILAPCISAPDDPRACRSVTPRPQRVQAMPEEGLEPPTRGL